MSSPNPDQYANMMRFFSYNHLPPNLAGISRECYELAEYMINALEPSAELTAGLRKLLEAKDCFVRANLPD